MNRAQKRAMSRPPQYNARLQRPRGISRIVAQGIDRAARERKARDIAQPMRAMFDLLASGEVLEIDGHPVMRMPECDKTVSERAEWCAISPAMLGWIDLWQRIAPEISTYHMRVLAERLEADKDLTPRLVELARGEFEACIRLIPEIAPGRIDSAIRTAQIAWEMERG